MTDSPGYGGFLHNLQTRVALLRANAMWRLVAPVRSFLVRKTRIGVWAQPVLSRAFPRLERFFAFVQGDPAERYRVWVGAYDTLDERDLLAMREELAGLADPPVLSIVVPIEEATTPTLVALVESLNEQVYERWEADFIGRDVSEDVSTMLAEKARNSRVRFDDGRMRTLPEAWNRAFQSATGFSVFVDPRVTLRPHSLFLIARAIVRHPDTVLVYADEDVIDDNGTRSQHYFKPDWSEALLCSQNYLGGLVAFESSLALQVGGCREELDDDCVWGLFLRMAAAAPQGTIRHLPFILSHRDRRQPSIQAHSSAERATGARAHEHRLASLGRQAEVEPVGDLSYRIRYELPETVPTVSVIIPTTCQLEFLRPCVDGILNRTSYDGLELILAVNEIQMEVPEKRDYLDTVAECSWVRVLVHEDRPFNYAWVNNWAVGQARGQLVCFLNDDTDVIGQGWLSTMVAHVVQKRVGAVGAFLLYPDDTIQHAGVVLGAGGVAAHNYAGKSMKTVGYNERALVSQDVSCVTAACMLVRSDIFHEVGAFDENLPIAFNDVDLCLRLRRAGWRIVWTPSATLYHRESVSIGRHDVGSREKEWKDAWVLMQSRWSKQLSADPHYSLNLSLDPLQLWEPAFPPRVSYPWRVTSRTSQKADASVKPSPDPDKPRAGPNFGPGPWLGSAARSAHLIRLLQRLRERE